MDIQTKLIFRISIYGNTNEVVNIIEKEVEINTYKYPKGYLGTELISFGEYEAVTVQLISNNENTQLIIETFEEELKLVKNNETINLTSRSDESGLLVPGEYIIRIKSLDKEFTGYYRINPSSLSWEGLENIRLYIENLVDGLAYNINAERAITKNRIMSIDNKYKIFKRHFEDFHGIIKSIIKNPITDVEKCNIYNNRYNSHESNVNILDYKNTIKHTKLSVNNLENKWLKKILTTYNSYLKELEDELILCTSEAYKDKLKDVLNLRGTICNYEKFSWINTISSYEKVKKPSFRLLRDKRYFTLYSNYNEMNIKNLGLAEEKEVYSFKKTSKLFEYYIFILIINIIKGFGYKWKSGWLADEPRGGLSYTNLEIGTLLKFENENNIIELAYDDEITDVDIKDLKSGFIPLNTRHNRPDIRIALFDKEYKFKNSLIVEVKCRKKRYLFNSANDTDIMRQLKDYKAFGYYEYISGSGKVIWDAVKKVIITYPKQFNDNEVYSDPIYNFSFIEIAPNENEMHIEGYNELSTQIEENLFE